LKSLSFGRDFSQSIDSVKFPPNLESLEFGDYFDQPLNNLPLNLINLFFTHISPNNLTNLPSSIRKIKLLHQSHANKFAIKYVKQLRIPYDCKVVDKDNIPFTI